MVDPFQLASSVLVSPVDPNEHTMPNEHFVAYAMGRFSSEQHELIGRVASNGAVGAFVVGVPSKDQEDWFLEQGYQVVARVARASRQSKKYNTIRYSVWHVRRESREYIAVACFPSAEYVFHISEALATVLMLNKFTSVPVKAVFVERYADLAASMEFDGIREHMLPEDFVVMGEIELIANELSNCGFEVGAFADFGALADSGEKTFSCARAISSRTGRTALLVGSRETFWGSALAAYVVRLLHLGADHIAYCAKAGRFQHDSEAHTVFVPDGYFAISKSRETGVETGRHCDAPSSLFGRDGPLCNLTIPFDSGVHLSVPTVVGETKEQVEIYKKKNPATIDNEISYAAVAVSQFLRERSDRARSVTFDSFHFVTDILKPQGLGHDESKPQVRLATKMDKNLALRTAKSRAFKQITAVLSEAIRQFGSQDMRKRDYIAEMMLADSVLRRDLDRQINGKRLHYPHTALCLTSYVPYVVYAGTREEGKALHDRVQVLLRGLDQNERADHVPLDQANTVLGLALAYVEFNLWVDQRCRERNKKVSAWEVNDIGECEERINVIEQGHRIANFEVAKLELTDADARQFVLYSALRCHLLHFRGQLALARGGSGDWPNKRAQSTFQSLRVRKYRNSVRARQALKHVESSFDKALLRAHMDRTILGWYNHDRHQSDRAWNEKRKKLIEGYLKDTQKTLQGLIEQARRSDTFPTLFLTYEHAFLMIALANYDPQFGQQALEASSNLLRSEGLKHLSYLTLQNQTNEYKRTYQERMAAIT